MKIFLGSDHAGYNLKEQLKQYLERQKFTVVDLGNQQLQQEDDYPFFSYKVSQEVSGNNRARGVLFCGNAQGVCIAANKVKGIRAAVGYSVYGAKTSRLDDNSNVLCLAGRVLTSKQAEQIVNAWLETGFSNAGRHQRRLSQIKQIENNEWKSVEIIPSLLVRNISQFKARLVKAEKYFPLVQLDVADGQLVANTTFSDWKQIRRLQTEVNYDLHLMVARPEEYLRQITSFNKIYRVFFHIESQANISRLIKHLRSARTHVGLAINPETPLAVLRPWLKKVDALLVMGVKPGFNGAPFLVSTVKRVKQLRVLAPHLNIVVDGGINPGNIQKVLLAGANAVVVGSYLQKSKNWSNAIARLRKT